MSSPTCLILGGCGFIGSHLAEALLKAGYRVRLFDKLNVNTANVAHILSQVEFFEGDFTNASDVRVAVGGTKYIFHLVSTTIPSNSNENPSFDLYSNVGSTLNLLNAAVKAGVNKVVFSSSGGTIYGKTVEIPTSEVGSTEPLCAYGISKLMIEKYLALYHHLYGLDYCCLRVANPYGERQNPEGSQGVVTVFLARVLRQKPIAIWGDGSVTRDYLYVKDVADAFVSCLNNSSSGKVFNVGSGRGISLKTLIDIIKDVTGVPFEVQMTPARNFDVPRNVLDSSLIQRELGWAPRIGLEEGIANTWKWLQKHYKPSR